MVTCRVGIGLWWLFRRRLERDRSICPGITLEDPLTRLNALKQAVAFSVNVAAAIFFLFSGQVVWSAALVMAVGALIGGDIWAENSAGRIKPSTLRWTVVESVS